VTPAVGTLLGKDTVINLQPSEWVFRAGMISLLAVYVLIVLRWRRGGRTDSEFFHPHTFWLVSGFGLAMLLMVGPCCWYLASPRTFFFFRLPWLPGVRIASWFFAAASLGLLAYTLRERCRLASSNTLVWPERGPYRFRRYPELAATSLFFIFLAGVTANSPVILSGLVGASVLRVVVARQLDASRLAQFGSHYAERMAQTGTFFWKITPPSDQYVVPHRFGLSSLLALLTFFGLLFGWFRYLEVNPVVYWFTASEITVICLAQILFGRAPRGASVLGGALLLPAWGFVAAYANTQSPSWFLMVLLSFILTPLGGFLGYCVGTLAAGFFLIVDVIDQYLPGGAASTAVTPSSLPAAYDSSGAASHSESPGVATRMGRSRHDRPFRTGSHEWDRTP
jgi:hypothetical protein